jgi:cardiolipin synthase
MTTMEENKKTTGVRDPRDERYKNAIITVPNVICFVRLVGSFVLLGFAIAGWRYWFVGLFLLLSLSDWIDGKLARWLHQRSDFGARLDSAADAALYVGLLGGMVILCWDRLLPELVWLGVGLGSYAVTTGAGLWKYGRVPSYHTYGAKFTQWLALIAGFCFVLGWAVWPLRLAMISVTLTNIEATLITCVLKDWQADVLTLFHVWPSRQQDQEVQ